MSEEIDMEAVQAYAGSVLGHMVGAATVICSDLAHKLGLFGHLAGSIGGGRRHASTTYPRITRPAGISGDTGV